MSEPEESAPRTVLWLLMLACAAAVLVMVGTGLFGDDGVRRHVRLDEQLAVLRARRVEAQTEHERLLAEKAALRESPAWVEHTIRQELGWIADGERVLELTGVR